MTRPQHWGCEGDYGKGLFNRADFENLKTLLTAIKGHFMLSINDVPEIREIFKGFRIETVRATYSIGKTEKKPAPELLIMNYEPANTLSFS